MTATAGGDLILTADFGTSSVKAGVVGRDLGLVASTSEPYPLAHDPLTGAAEQNPADWWSAFARAITALKRDIPDLPARAAAIVFSGQMCGVVCTDEAGAPLRPALIWLDKRAGEEARALAGGFLDYRGYGLLKLARWLTIANGAPALNGADPPAKMRWLRDHEPDIWSRTRRLLDVKDWLLLQATGRAATTPDCANLTWMMNSRAGRIGWSAPLMRLVGIESARLPDIVDGTEIVGALTGNAAAATGLRPGTPVVAGAGDVCAAAIGSGAVADNAMHIHVGTSSWIAGFLPKRALSIDPPFATVAGAVEGRPLLIATQETSGQCLEWAIGALGFGRADDAGYEALIAAASSCAPAADDPLFLPWLAGERMPIDDEKLRGGFVGLALGHDRRHLARAVIEGVCLNLRWAMEAVTGKIKLAEGALPAVGGTMKIPFFVQTLADVLQRPLRPSPNPHGAGLLGAAAIGAAALGWRKSVWEAAAEFGSRSTIAEPDRALGAHYAARLERFKDAQRRMSGWR